MNRTTYIGHVGKNIQFLKKEAPADKSAAPVTLLSFSVASNEVTGKGVPVTNWIKCLLWGARAEALKEHLVTGQSVYVEGRAEARPYLSNDKQAKAELVLHVNEFEFIGAKPDKAPAKVTGDEPVDGVNTPPDEEA
jgi:single-strand DNA-binding protein